MPEVNDHLVLICGESAGGKSASLRNLKKPEGVLYLNCEAGKHLPFPSKFKEVRVTDPKIIPTYFEQIEKQEQFHNVIIDSTTFMMDMFESMHVIGATNTMNAWGNYAQFFKNLMQDSVVNSTKNVIMLAHIETILNEETMISEHKVPVKGQLAKNGIEAFFSTVIYARKVSLKQLEGYENDLLNITPEEEAMGMKYVFQTRLTKETINDRIRSNMGMWSINETYIDNDAQLIMDRLHQYYD